MPYGGMYRLIDFPLSNCMHSGIEDVWVIQQYQPHGLNDYVSNGRPWDLDRTYGGLRILHPHLGDEEGGFHQGNADAIWRNARLIREYDPDVLLVLSSDHVYKLDYRDVVAHHLDGGRNVTLVVTEVRDDDPSRFGVVVVGKDGSVSEYDYKPDDPKTTTVATEVFAFDPTALLDRLEHLADSPDDDDEGSSLEDLGDDVLPWMVEQKNATAFRLPGYWRDLGTIEAYWGAHMDLLNEPPDIDLGGTDWPVRTVATQRPPARVHSSAAIEDALLSPGCSVHGRATRSVLAPGVVVEEDAVVSDSVLLQDCVVKAGATVERSIVDGNVRVGRDARVGSATAGETEDGLVVIGMGAKIENGSTVEPGSHIDPA